MTPESLEKLQDDELQAVIVRSQEILKDRDRKRKDTAMEEARAILLRAGLTPRDLTAKRKPGKSGTGKPAGKTLVYRGGQRYQHPSNPALVWKAKGKKPQWLTALEAEGKAAVELPVTVAA